MGQGGTGLYCEKGDGEIEDERGEMEMVGKRRSKVEKTGKIGD